MPAKGRKMSRAQKKAMQAGLARYHANKKRGKENVEGLTTEDLIVAYAHGKTEQFLTGLAENAGLSPSALTQRVCVLLQGKTSRKPIRIVNSLSKVR